MDGQLKVAKLTTTQQLLYNVCNFCILGGMFHFFCDKLLLLLSLLLYKRAAKQNFPDCDCKDNFHL